MAKQKTLFDLPKAVPVWDDQRWNMTETMAQRIFSPSSPIDEGRLFSGRIQQVRDLLGVIYERGGHAVLYGERGVGKSSLANTIADKIPDAVTNIKIYKDNCRPDDSFFDLWSKMLWDFKFDGVDASEFLKDEAREFVVVKILESLPKATQYVFMFDEFDRITSASVKISMADTIKHFSDYPQNITIVIVGVGFSIDELFGAHPSIQRCCRQVPMPRMSDFELLDILNERYFELGLSVADDMKQKLVNLAQGLPGFAHLAGREAALSAIRRKSRTIEDFDYAVSVKESVRRAQESIVSSYNKATYSAKENIYKEVLLACSLAERDDRGKFSASDVRKSLSVLLGRKVEISAFARHLAAFCDKDRGPVLRKTGKRKSFQYQFIEATLQPYILMVGKRDGLI